MKTTELVSIAVGVIVVAAAVAYVSMTPYNRIAGVRIGGGDCRVAVGLPIISPVFQPRGQKG